MTEPFIAVDWGTSSRRVYRIEDGEVIDTEYDDLGASKLTATEYPRAVEAIRTRMGDLPILLAGMAGSDIGWRKASYVEAPARLNDLAEALERIDDRTAIVPGVCYRDGGRADVMRGEEVQLLGAAAAGLVPGEGLLCQPGTHCKWVELREGAITRFTTAMTGELFSILSNHGLLARQLAGPVELGPAFLEGVGEGSRRDLATSLFSIRARGVLGLLEEKDAPSFASGVLIGADVAARIDHGDEVHIVSDPGLGAFYAVAIDALGGSSRLVDSHSAFVTGINRIWELAA